MVHQALSDLDWESILETLDTDSAWMLFKNIFQDIIDRNVPTYSV